jgi:muramidase (phage lysozyme)
MRPVGVLPPDRVRYCESRGDYTAQNRRSSASGGWQITDGSWGGYQGYAHAKDAPPAVQDARAAELWNGGRGAHNWEACL